MFKNNRCNWNVSAVRQKRHLHLVLIMFLQTHLAIPPNSGRQNLIQAIRRSFGTTLLIVNMFLKRSNFYLAKIKDIGFFKPHPISSSLDPTTLPAPRAPTGPSSVKGGQHSQIRRRIEWSSVASKKRLEKRFKTHSVAWASRFWPITVNHTKLT